MLKHMWKLWETTLYQHGAPFHTETQADPIFSTEVSLKHKRQVDSTWQLHEGSLLPQQ